jgi:hypothetical protein
MSQRAFVCGLCVWIASAIIGCASSPKPAVPTGGARVRYIDLANGVELSLASESMEPYRSQRESGTLPRGLKLLPDDQLGALIAFMRSEKFFDYAAALSPDDPNLKGKTKQVIALETHEQVLTFPFSSNPGNDAARGAAVGSFIHIKNRIREIFEQTTQFSGVR